MNWSDRMSQWLKENNGEGVQTEKGLVFVFPKIKNQASHKRIIKGIMPEGSQFEIMEAPKPSTMKSIAKILKEKVGGVSSDSKDRHFVLNTSTQPGMGQFLGIMMGGAPQTIRDPITLESKEWDMITEILTKDGYFDSWEFFVDGQSNGPFHKIYSAEFAKHQENGEPITKDTLLNLKISLNKVDTIDAFLKEIGA